MSILTAAALKPVLLLTLRSVRLPLCAIGRALCGAAEMRGRAVASTYLMAMGLNADRPPDPCRRGDRDY
ncbi:MAG TPA: hypothetical protein VHA35_22410 [Dongiaceae bacterium]|nr:hypothetical protein [Dongiaceae bacterium]